MAVPSSHCEAKKHGYRQTEAGIVISFVLHPHEVPDDLALAELGTRYMLALVRIGDDEEPQAPHPSPHAARDKTEEYDMRPKRPSPLSWDELKPSNQAGIKCNDKAFQDWAVDGSYPEKAMAAYARRAILDACGIQSRTELDSNDGARRLWEAMLARFHTATGRTAEQRG